MRCEPPRIRFHPEKKNRPKVMVAESDPDASARLVSLLESEGADVVAVRNGREAAVMCRCGKDRIILAAADLPDLDAVSFLREAGAGRNGNLFLIMAAGQGADSAEILRRGACEVIRKPVDPATFPLVIRRVLEKRSLSRKVDFLKGLTALLIFMIPLVMTAGILLAVD